MALEARDLLKEGDILIVYKWRPDHFIASILLSDIILSRGGKLDLIAYDPNKMNKAIQRKVWIESRKYDTVVLLGPGMQGPEIDMLASNILAPLVVVDNGYTYLTPKKTNVVYFNPSPRGDPRGTWPSITFTLATLFGRASDLLVAASIVSISGAKSRAVRAFQNSMSKNGLNHIRDFNIPLECAIRALAVTTTGDPGALARMPMSLSEASLGDLCKAILDDALLATHAGMLEALIEGINLNDNPIHPPPGSGRSLLLHLAREYSYRSSSIGMAIRDDSFCIWSPGKLPIAPKISELRREGFYSCGVYQGLVNYVCGEIPANRRSEDVLKLFNKK